MSGSYNFRIKAEGFQEFVNDLRSISGESEAAQRAIETLIQSSPQLASSMNAAAEATERAARASRNLAPAVQETTDEVTQLQQALAQIIGGSGGSFGNLGNSLAPVQQKLTDAAKAIQSASSAATAGATGFGLIAPAATAAAAAITAGILVWRNWDDIVEKARDSLTAINDVLGIFPRQQELTNTALRSSQQWFDAYAAAVGRARGEVNDLAQAEFNRVRLANVTAQQSVFVEQSRYADALGPAAARLGEIQTQIDTFAQNARNYGGTLALPRGRVTLSDLQQQLAAQEQEVARLQREWQAREAETARLRSGLADLEIQGPGLYRQTGIAGAPAATSTGGGSGRAPRAETITPYGMIDDRPIWETAQSGILSGGSADVAAIREIQNATRGTILDPEFVRRMNDERVKAERDALQQVQDANKRVTDDIVRYGADSFADLFDANGRGWEGMLDTFGTTFRRLMARLAAEAIIRPVVEPIVSGLNLGGIGSLFTGNLNIPSSAVYAQALSQAAGGQPGAAVGGMSGGGMLSNLSNLWSASSAVDTLTGGSMLSGLTGYSSFGGMASAYFGMSNAAPAATLGMADAAALQAALPATPAAGSAALSTLGYGAAGAGLGYLGGSMLGNRLAGDSRARQENAQIGAGGGALAGAAIGATFGPIGAAIGGIIGGLAGGGGGGLIGPGAKTNAFSFDLRSTNGDLGASGLRTTGDGNGGTEEIQAVQQSLARFNAIMDAANVSVADFNRTINGTRDSSDQSRSLDSAIGMFRFTATDSRMQTALDRDPKSSAEGIAQTITEAQQLIAVLDALAKPTRTFKDTAQDLWQSFEANIASAQRLGFGEAELRAEQQKQQDKLWAERNQQIADITASLRANELRAMGRTPEADRMDFDRGAANAVKALREQLEALGMTSEEVAAQVAVLESTQSLTRAAQQRAIEKQAAERAAALDDIAGSLRANQLRAMGLTDEADRMDFDRGAANAVKSLRDQLEALGATAEFTATQVATLEATQDLQRQALTRQDATARNAEARRLLEDLTVGDLGGLSPAARSAAARQSILGARNALLDGATEAEMSEFSRVVQSGLPVIQQAEGLSSGFASFVGLITDTLRGTAPGSDTANLASLIDATLTGTDRVEAAVYATKASIADLQAEVARLNTQLAALAARAA